MLKIIINGCNGKMGQVVAQTASSLPNFSVVAGVDMFPDSKQNPFPVYKSLHECNEKADVIIDFSVPAAIRALLEAAQKRKTPVVVATTGFSKDEISFIHEKAKSIPIFLSANMSLGVNVMSELAQKAASALGEKFDIEIIEKHHNQKIDAPSGTAYALADAINKVLRNSKSYVFGRYTKTQKRSKNEIGIHAVRGGTIVGQHTVLFAGSDEVLEITHTAYSKQIFALGALSAAEYIAGKSPGLYGMKDMLAEKTAVTNVYTEEDQAMISIQNLPNSAKYIASILQAIADKKINIDMISHTPGEKNDNLSFTLPKENLNEAVCVLEKLRDTYSDISINVYENIVKITVEGEGMENQPGIAAKIFDIMASQNVKPRAITTSKTEISYIIDKNDGKKAVEAIIGAFEL